MLFFITAPVVRAVVDVFRRRNHPQAFVYRMLNRSGGEVYVLLFSSMNQEQQTTLLAKLNCIPGVTGTQLRVGCRSVSVEWTTESGQAYMQYYISRGAELEIYEEALGTLDPVVENLVTYRDDLPATVRVISQRFHQRWAHELGFGDA